MTRQRRRASGNRGDASRTRRRRVRQKPHGDDATAVAIPTTHKRSKPRGPAPHRPRRNTESLSRNTRATRYQLYACTFLCAAGATIGVIRAAMELGFHCASTQAALGHVGVTAALGIILGLWLPRRLIHQRMRQSGTGPDPAERPTVELEFATSMLAALLLILAILWLGFVGVMHSLENWRILLTTRLLLPASIMRGLIISPADVALLVLSGTGTTVLLTLHGAFQLAARRGRDVMRLWLVILLGIVTAASSLTLSTISHPGTLDVLLLLAAFMATAIAAIRRPSGQLPTEPHASPSVPPVGLRTPLVSVAAASMLVVTAMHGTITIRPDIASTIAITLAVAGGGSLAGILLARMLLSCMSGTAPHTAPVALLLATAIFLTPSNSPSAAAGSFAQLALVAVFATICITLVASRAATETMRTQQTLAWLGVAAATGIGAGSLLAIWTGTRNDFTSEFALVTLMAMTAGGVDLVLAARLTARWRVCGVVGVGLCLVLLLSFSRAPLPGNAPATLIRGTSHRTTPERLNPLSPLSDHLSQAAVCEVGDRAGHVDLGGPAWDTIVLHAQTTDSRDSDRLIRRCRRALRPGGRLIVELPAGTTAVAALNQSDTGGYYLRSIVKESTFEALIIGPDIPAWLHQQSPSDLPAVRLHRIQTPAALDDVRAAAALRPA